MADKKISQLTALAAANLAPSTDVLAIVDTSATETKKIVAQDLINGVLNVASAVGIGTTSPAFKLDVNGSLRVGTATSVGATAQFGNTGNVITFIDSGATGVIGVSGANPLTFYTNGAERLRIDSAGNLGLGVTPSASWFASAKAMQIGSSGAPYMGLAQQTTTTCDGYMLWGARLSGDRAFQYTTTGDAVCAYRQNAGTHNWFTAGSGTAGNAISFTQAMTLDADGDLAIGATSASDRLHVERNWNGSTWIKTVNTDSGAGAAAGMLFKNNTGDLGAISLVSSANSPADSLFLRSLSTNPLVFGTNNTERARIDSSGNLMVGTTNENPAGANVTGHSLKAGGLAEHSNASNVVVVVNRKTDDGDLIRFLQDGTQEGSISVSGNTVSYNAFAGSHWSQLQDGSKPDILRGTVMESINELCVWPDETNERLPKSKISDTAGSKKVYGVFMAWDNDWTETNDMYVTAVGAFICRINSSVTVQEGDLLESNGDGTARVQADDIIRSSTIGKVTSTVKTHQYDDGSYCVPTVLYCG